MDSNIRELTGVTNLMTIDNLNVLNGMIIFGKKTVGFEIEDRGPDSLAGDELETFLEGYQDEKILICITVRWLAVVQKEGVYYVFNSHSCRPDGSPDFSNESEAAVFRCENARDAAKYLRLFGCAEDSPHSYFSVHAVKLN